MKYTFELFYDKLQEIIRQFNLTESTELEIKKFDSNYRYMEIKICPPYHPNKYSTIVFETMCDNGCCGVLYSSIETHEGCDLGYAMIPDIFKYNSEQHLIVMECLNILVTQQLHNPKIQTIFRWLVFNMYIDQFPFLIKERTNETLKCYLNENRDYIEYTYQWDNIVISLNKKVFEEEYSFNTLRILFVFISSFTSIYDEVHDQTRSYPSID